LLKEEAIFSTVTQGVSVLSENEALFPVATSVVSVIPTLHPLLHPEDPEP
jgi:hypothetical protein